MELVLTFLSHLITYLLLDREQDGGIQRGTDVLKVRWTNGRH